MAITLIKAPAAVPSGALPDLGPVVEPKGEPIADLRGRADVDDETVEVGVWECTVGTWRRQVVDPEFCNFIAGRARFVPDVGEPIAFGAGDSVYFPANSAGTWIVEETLRKTYAIFKRR